MPRLSSRTGSSPRPAHVDGLEQLLDPLRVDAVQAGVVAEVLAPVRSL